jgi:hypothetical protein
MASIFTKLFGRNSRKMSPGRRIRKDRVQLGVEQLENRELLSSTPITDMTQWARATVKPASTVLYLNFDGNGSNIKAFQPQAGQNRDAAIQDIIYRVSEIFSPFDVIVSRIQGSNYYHTSGGDTTIFIGGDTADVKPDTVLGRTFTKYAYSNGTEDYPHSNDWSTHGLHSNPYNLAKVDPMATVDSKGNPVYYASPSVAQDPSKWVNVRSDDAIARAIAHEAGHTFGLAHIRTDKLRSNPRAGFVTDPRPLPTFNADGSPKSDNQGTVPEMMSYTDANQYFVNQTFPVTDFNNTGTATNPDPSQYPYSHYEPVPGLPWISIPAQITTQNSFTYLEAVFGDRAADGDRHWSDPNTVDPSSHNNAAPVAIGPGTDLASGSYWSTGYNVYKLSVATTQQVHVNVQPQTEMSPVLMVHDSNGNSLPFFASAVAYANARIDFQANGGQTYYVIVGSKDSMAASGFSYHLTVTANAPVPILAGATFTFTAAINPSLVVGTLKVLSEDVNTGQFLATYTNLHGITFFAQGLISGTNTAGGVTTSSIEWSVLMGTFYRPQFRGWLQGTGSARPGGWHDTISGFDADYFVGSTILSLVSGRDF